MPDQPKTARKLWQYGGILIVLVGLLLGWDFYRLYHVDSDVELIEQYKTHRADFALLVKMIREDQNKSTSMMTVIEAERDYSDSPSNLISESRLDEYQRLLNEVGARTIIANKFTVNFTLSSGKGIFKSLVFSEGSVAGTRYEQPDTYQPTGVPTFPEGGSEIGYLEIEPNWYLQVTIH